MLVTESPEQISEPPAPRKRVLVVEDDSSSRLALQYLLKRAGCEVTIADCIAEGFAVFDLQRPPHSVVLDLMLPDGDGAVLLAHFRQHAPSTRVIVATGVLDEIWLDRVKAMGVTSILRKPIVMSELLQLL